VTDSEVRRTVMKEMMKAIILKKQNDELINCPLLHSA